MCDDVIFFSVCQESEGCSSEKQGRHDDDVSFFFNILQYLFNKFFFIFLHFVENFRICRGLKRLTILQKHFMAGGCSLKLLVMVLVLSLN